MRWILIEATDRVLPEIDQKLADYAVRELRGRGIEIRLGTTIESIEAKSTKLSTGEVVPTETVVWTAGVAPHPSLRNLSVPLDERGRVIVGEDLAVQGMTGVWAIGDCAAVPSKRGGYSPPTAQHSVRQAKVAANNIAAALGNGEKRDFTYRGQAAFVNLGRYKAVGSLGSKFTFSGWLAWWMARTYHLSQIPGFARKIRAVIDWTVSLPFPRDVADVGSFERPRELTSEVFEFGGSHRPLPRGEDQ
jgi:NADH dehydrogenase